MKMPSARIIEPWNAEREGKAAILIPLVTLLVACTTDWFIHPGFSIFPVACAVGLLLIAFLYSSKQTIVWGIIFFCATFLALYLQKERWTNGLGNADALVITRSLVLAIVGLLAFTIARQREKSKSVFMDLCRVFEQLQSPVIVSDVNGWIRFSNSATSTFFLHPPDHNLPYWEFFRSTDKRGTSIQEYVNLASDVGSRNVLMTSLSTRSDEKSFIASMNSITIGEIRMLLTIILCEERQP